MKPGQSQRRHQCPICMADFESRLEGPPTVCPACGLVILHCGVCENLILRSPVVYCRECKRPLCLNCRGTDEPEWRSLKWWSVCWNCTVPE